MFIRITLVLLAIVSSINTAQGYRDVSFMCQMERVLAFVKQNSTEIDLNQVEVTVCGEKRTCTYTKGAACVGKGNYVAGVMEKNGKISLGCCLITPPVHEHQGDECSTQLHIESSDTGKYSAGHAPGSSGAAPGASHPAKPPVVLKSIPNMEDLKKQGGDKKEVMMTVKNLPPAQPTQFVKSITKFAGNNGQGYTVTLCTPQCGRSTTTTRRPSTQTPPKKTEEKKDVAHPKKGLFPGGHHCFSGDMTVETPMGAKRMEHLRAGDQVLVTTIDSKPIFEPIEWLYHRDPIAIADFITVTTKSHRTLRLSANHLIPVIPCDAGNLTTAEVDRLTNSQSYFARRLRPGHCLAIVQQAADGKQHFVVDHVTGIKRERQSGIYSPITARGTLVVNGVLVSCYSSVENHAAQKTVHSALINVRRGLAKVSDVLFGSSSLVQEDSQIPLPLRMLLKMAQFIVPASVFGQ